MRGVHTYTHQRMHHHRRHTHRTSRTKGETRDRARRTRLLGRTGHLRRHRMDRRGDRRRGHRRGRGRRPGRRGPGRHPQARARLRRGGGRGGRRQGRVRRRVLPPGDQGQRPLHGPLPAGLRALPADHRQAPGGRRQEARRLDRRPRLHRQGQRPGPLRGRHLLPRPRADLHRAGPRLRDDPGQGDRLLRGEEPPHRHHQEVPLLDRPERLRAGRRDRLPRGHLERPDRGRLRVHPESGRAPRGRRGGHHLQAGRPGRHRRQAGHRPAGHPAAQRACGRPGRRPDRHGRGPPGRHQVPRGVRGSGCDRPDHRPPGAGERHRRARTGPLQASGRAALGRAGLRRPVVLPAQAGPGRLHRRGQPARHRRHPDDPARRPRRRHRPEVRPVPVRLQPGDLRHRRHV